MFGDGDQELSKGCEYAVHVSGDGDKTFTGIFKGYIMLGADAALAMDCGGETHYVPTSQISYMTVVSRAAPKLETRYADGINYG
jgi:hypothetical protein